MRAPRVYVIAALTVLVLGLNWPIMAIGVTAIPPLWMTTVRLLGAACLVAAALAAVGGLQRPTRADYPILASVSMFRLALVTALVLTALQRVPPGRSSILVYTSSLWAMPMAAVFLRERLGALRIAGVVSACLGILLLVQPWSLDWSRGSTAIGYGMLLTAAFASAACTVHIRGHHWRRTELELMPWAFAAAGTVTGLLALLVEGAPGARWNLTLVAILAYQAVLASALAFWGVLIVSRSLPAVSTNLTLMAVPAVGLTSSAWLNGEPLTVPVGLSLLLIVAGVVAGGLSDRPGDEP